MNSLEPKMVELNTIFSGNYEEVQFFDSVTLRRMIRTCFSFS